jgi:hypothetical protein
MEQWARGRCGSSATHPSGQAARQPAEVCPASGRGSAESSRAHRSCFAERGSVYDGPGRCSREPDSNARQRAASTESQSITCGGCSEGEIDGEVYDMDADNRLKAMRNKRTSERLNPLDVDLLRCTYVAVRA